MHRSGRTGRAGKYGHVFDFAIPNFNNQSGTILQLEYIMEWYGIDTYDVLLEDLDELDEIMPDEMDPKSDANHRKRYAGIFYEKD